MRMSQLDQVEWHKLGDLRIAGPEEEVKAFMEWLKSLPDNLCYVWGYDEVPAPNGLKAYDVSVDIYFTTKVVNDLYTSEP